MGETAQGSVYAHGRAEVVGRLYADEAATVRRLVASRARVPIDVLDDACQTAWERLWAHPEVNLQRDAAMRWLVVTAVRLAWREHGRGLARGFGELDGACERSLATDPFDVALVHEETAELVERLRALSARQRQFLAMHAAGLSYGEIAVQTGSTMRTVERQILRGRRTLTEQARRDGSGS